MDQIIPKLCVPCYTFSSMFHTAKLDTLKTIYFAYFESTMKYVLTFVAISVTQRKLCTVVHAIPGLFQQDGDISCSI